jgi:hypothetical protein
MGDCWRVMVLKMGKGHNVKNQNVESLKVDQKFEKDQNVKSLFLN